MYNITRDSVKTLQDHIIKILTRDVILLGRKISTEWRLLITPLHHTCKTTGGARGLSGGDFLYGTIQIEVETLYELETIWTLARKTRNQKNQAFF